jgi:hypothetical protein
MKEVKPARQMPEPVIEVGPFFIQEAVAGVV